MACNYPITGNRGTDGIVREDKTKLGSKAWQITIACGQCRGCRLEKSRQWAVRIMHERQMNDPDKCHFITLTYDDEYLPPLGSLVLQDWQKFARRVRKKKGPFRFYHCGEYGEEKGRPHYHACVFGLELDDLVVQGKTKSGETAYQSDELEELWGKGFTQVGTLTFESAAYVARYIMKKINGKEKEEGHYNVINKKTGEIIGEKKQEYTTMSRNKGIGKTWIEKYKTDVYPRDEVILNAKKMRPPKFYDSHYEITDPQKHKQLKYNRAKKAKNKAADQTHARLKTKENILRQREERYKREPEWGM